MEKQICKEKKKSKFDQYTSQVDGELLKKWKEEQDFLKDKLIEVDDFPFTIETSKENSLKRIGGMDISASKNNPDVAVVALVVIDADSYSILYEKYEFVTMTQPYVPGFLAFREVDHLIKLILELQADKPELAPQVILTDGNGIFHSNRFGLACHLGVLSNIPTIGCAKTVFFVDGINKYAVKKISKTLQKTGEFAYLKGDSGATWGAALKCTSESTDPIIVNIGHKISLDSAINIVKNSCKYRVPEPIRIADLRSRAIIRQYETIKTTFDIDEYLNKVKQNLKENN